MKLDSDVNFIVSGLERSGTSMLMQILEAGGVPMAFDTASRPPDDNNPKGYFEFERVKKLQEGKFISVDKTEGGTEGNTTIVKFKDVEKKLSDF